MRFSNKIYDSAILIAIVSSILYFCGFTYFRSYYSTFSKHYILIPKEYHEISEYITVGFFSFAVLLIIIILFNIILEKTSPHDKKHKCYLMDFFNILPLFLVEIYILIGFFENNIKIIFIIFITLLLFLAILKFKKEKSYDLYKINKLPYYIVPLILLIASSVILSSILGTVLAEIYIEEMTEKNTEEIHVFLKDKTNTQLENKSIILFKKNADEYYIIVKNETTQQYPITYIIQSNQIEMISYQKI